MKIQVSVCEYAHCLVIQIVCSAEKSNNYFCSMKKNDSLLIQRLQTDRLIHCI